MIYCEGEGRRWPLADLLILTYEAWCLTVKRQCHVHSDSHNLALNSNFKPRDGAAEGGAAIRIKKESIVENYSLLWFYDAIAAVGLSRKIHKGIDKLQLLYCSGYQRRLQDQKIWKISHLKLELKHSRIVYTIVTNNSWDVNMCSQWKPFCTFCTNWFLKNAP